MKSWQIKPWKAAKLKLVWSIQCLCMIMVQQGLVLPTWRVWQSPGRRSNKFLVVAQYSALLLFSHSWTPNVLENMMASHLKVFSSWSRLQQCSYYDFSCAQIMSGSKIVVHSPFWPFCLIFKFSCYAVYYIQSLTSGKSTCSLISDQYCLSFTQMLEITLPTASHKSVMAFHLNWI